MTGRWPRLDRRVRSGVAAKTLASVKRPNTEGLRPVVLSVSTVRSHSVTGRWQGPVKHDRTHPVGKNTFWTLTVNDQTLRVQRPVSSVGASGQHFDR